MSLFDILCQQLIFIRYKRAAIYKRLLSQREVVQAKLRSFGRLDLLFLRAIHSLSLLDD